MTDGEKKLHELFLNYSFNEQQLRKKEERLKSKTYKITPSYSSTGGGGGNGTKSKVEDYTEKVLKLKREIAYYRRKVDTVKAALECPELSNLERRTLRWIADGGHLKTFAELEGIYISRIYKMRDKALKKALRSLKTTN